jgi:hypothetical protein
MELDEHQESKTIQGDIGGRTDGDFDWSIRFDTYHHR